MFCLLLIILIGIFFLFGFLIVYLGLFYKVKDMKLLIKDYFKEGWLIKFKISL